MSLLTENELDKAVKIFKENCERVDPQADPTNHNMATGLLALARGLAQLKDEVHQIRIEIEMFRR